MKRLLAGATLALLVAIAWGWRQASAQLGPTTITITVDESVGASDDTATRLPVTASVDESVSVSEEVIVTRIDTTPPVVTAPVAITIPATQANGALSAASPPLAAFLPAGSAVDSQDPSPIRLSPQVGGIDVTGSTLFPIGTTTVTFRFRDHSSNVGTATSSVTVVLGLPRLAGTVLGKGRNTDGSYYVDVQLTNAGTGNARNISITSLALRALAGTGSVTLISPALPIAVGNLDVGSSITVHLTLNAPSSVTRFSITETGTTYDVAGTKYSFSIGQAVVP